MEVANEAEARERGWTPSMGSFGINSYPDSSGGGGSGGSSGGGVRSVQASPDTEALRNFFSQTAGFSREELAERARQFNEQLAFQERQWTREGLPRIEIEKRLADARIREIEETIGLNKARLGLEYINTVGRLGLDRAQLGLNYLSTAAQLGGPQDYFQQAAFLRGARAAGAGDFLSDLEQNRAPAAFSGVGPNAPDPQTMQSLSAAMGGTPSVTPTDTNALLQRIGSIFRRGPTSVAPGSLERLDQDELALLSSAGKALGFDPNSWLRAYTRAGVGQQASSAL